MIPVVKAMKAMKNSEYWRRRFETLEKSLDSIGQEAYFRIEPAFDEALRDIDRQIEKWMYRIADNNKLSLTDARKLLDADQLAEFHWSVEEYIKHGQENAINQQWMKQLENASAKYHISRLEALKVQTQQSLEKAFGNYLDGVDGMARKVYSEGYYRTAFELQRGFGVGWDIASIDEKKLSKLIAKPWAADGKNFSDRIWQAKSQMVDELHKQLTRTCILGKSPDEAIKAMTKYVKNGVKNAKSQAARLVMTEQAFFASAAEKDAYLELGVKEYEIVATLDSHTSEICQELDGKHFPMAQYEAGVTAPPFHVYCRSTTCPYFDDEFTVGEMRAARGEDGKTYYVPAGMKYPEWKNSFADGGDKLGISLVGVTMNQSSGIIKQNREKDNGTMVIQNLGKLDVGLIEGEFGVPFTDEIIITGERIEHIKKRHPEDYSLFQQYGVEAITNPDMVISDGKNDNTVFMIKKLAETNLNVVVKVAVDIEHPDYKNSVITFYRLRNRNLEKLKKKAGNKILYTKE